MKRKWMIVAAVVLALLAAYALYSVIGYTVIELQYPVLRSQEGTAYFGGNLIMLGIAAGVFLLSAGGFSALMVLLLRKKKSASEAASTVEEQKAA